MIASGTQPRQDPPASLDRHTHTAAHMQRSNNKQCDLVPCCRLAQVQPFVVEGEQRRLSTVFIRSGCQKGMEGGCGCDGMLCTGCAPSCCLTRCSDDVCSAAAQLTFLLHNTWVGRTFAYVRYNLIYQIIREFSIT